MWSVTCCAGIASLPRCTKSPRAWRCSWHHHTAQKFYKSYAVGVLECGVVSANPSAPKVLELVSLVPSKTNQRYSFSLGGGIFKIDRPPKAHETVAYVIMFNLRVYNTGTTSSKIINSSQHLHTGQTGPTCPQLGPNLVTQLGPKLGPTRANIPDPTRSAENTLLPQFPTLFGFNRDWPWLFPNTPKLRHVGPMLDPSWPPTWSPVVQVGPRLSQSWADLGACSAQLKAS